MARFRRNVYLSVHPYPDPDSKIPMVTVVEDGVAPATMTLEAFTKLAYAPSDDAARALVPKPKQDPEPAEAPAPPS